MAETHQVQSNLKLMKAFYTGTGLVLTLS